MILLFEDVLFYKYINKIYSEPIVILKQYNNELIVLYINNEFDEYNFVVDACKNVLLQFEYINTIKSIVILLMKLFFIQYYNIFIIIIKYI